MRTLLTSFFCLLFSASLLAQMSYDDVELEMIPYRKVRKYIEDQRVKANIETFSELQATCSNEEDFSDYAVCTRTYVIKASLEEVWQTYRKASPTTAWATRKSKCAMVYERDSDRVVYEDGETEGTNAGQVLYMNLKLIKGLYNLATAFEITRIEDELGVIEVSYTESGINQGKQVIQMEETDKGFTRIVHTSMVKSDSNFRDRVLYPYFHSKLIRAFHKKMRRMVMREEFSSPVA